MASAQNAPAKSTVLNSWKEIAVYLGRGVRTVQRWEHDLGLPVRRPRGKSRSAVIAMSDELDAWLRQAPASETLAPESSSPESSRSAAIVAADVLSRDEGDELRRRCELLRSEHQTALVKLVNNLKTMSGILAAARTLPPLSPGKAQPEISGPDGAPRSPSFG